MVVLAMFCESIFLGNILNLIRPSQRMNKSYSFPQFLLISLITLIGLAQQAQAREEVRSLFEQIKIAGEEPLNGFFDVSIEYSDDGIGWLAYSRVDIPKYVETHVAKSTNGGETWQFVGVVNKSFADSVLIDGKPQEGVWRYETSTLLFDKNDTPERRWKLFSHRYFTVPPYDRDDRLFEKGWIEYKYASNPDGRWSDGVRLFGREEHHSLVNLNSLHPDLRGFHHYTELGSIVKDGTIYLSMDASTTASGLGRWKERKIVLVSSHDHGVTWRYVGTLTDYADADNLGYVTLTGSSLVREQGREFLLLSPSGAKGLFKKNRGHDGTIIVEFEDLQQAKLKRDAAGRLVVLKAYKPDLTSGGLSDYDEQNFKGGMLFSQINLSAMPTIFQIFSTQGGITPSDTRDN